MRDDLLELADRLELNVFMLCGHSMGGSVAAIFAEKHADRLTGLILVDTPPPDGDGEWSIPSRPEGRLDYDWNCFVDILGQFAEPDPSWWSELAAITVPTLILGGGSTSPVPQHKLGDVAARIPSASLVTVEGAGHVVQQTRPSDFLAKFGKFF